MAVSRKHHTAGVITFIAELLRLTIGWKSNLTRMSVSTNGSAELDTSSPDQCR